MTGLMKRVLVASVVVSVSLFGRLATAEMLAYQVQGAVLPNAPDYDWWYGCSPTSAGMIMGYYDNQGYSNLVPGGAAETENFTNSGMLAKNAIASSGHIAAFYGGGYNATGDDKPSLHPNFDSLADFMGTSQDFGGYAVGNGGTLFYYYPSGARLTAANALSSGIWNRDGMYGIGEYANYAGYEYDSLYTQATDNVGSLGFTFAQYMAEIDAGRPVLIHVYGHSMFGYGYDAASRQVYVHDTWSLGQHSFTWGGSYAGMGLWGVTALDLQPLQAVPEPSVMLAMLGMAATGLPYALRRIRKNVSPEVA